jgi:hypothetical protein
MPGSGQPSQPSADWGIRSPPEAVLLTQPNGEFRELIGDPPPDTEMPQIQPVKGLTATPGPAP